MTTLPTCRGRVPQFLQPLLLACGAVLGLFLWQGHQGFSLADEGYLWYGVQRVMAGEVPLRDFSSLRPGRYYLSAALMGFGATAASSRCGPSRPSSRLWASSSALMLLQRSMPKPSFLFLPDRHGHAGGWMFPRHKLFDITTSIALVGALAFLIRQPSSRRYFWQGWSWGSPPYRPQSWALRHRRKPIHLAYLDFAAPGPAPPRPSWPGVRASSSAISPFWR